MERGNKNTVDLNPDIAVVILNINGLNIPVNRYFVQLCKNNFMLPK